MGVPRLGIRQSKIYRGKVEGGGGWVTRDMYYKVIKVILLVLALFIRYFFRTINLIQLGLF